MKTLAGALTVAVLLAGCSASDDEQPSHTDTRSAAPAATVCDRMQPGPATAPAGAVAVDPAVENDLITKTKESPPGTTFWLMPGTHRFRDERYDQVAPKDGNTYLGAPGAILDGRKVNEYAFTGQARDVAVRYLTVRGFVAPHDEGVVNHDSGDGWIIEHNTIEANSGAALMAGARQQIRGNCLRDNGQYGINAYKAGNTIKGLVIEGNEITGNNTDDWETRSPGCGCSGGVKFWSVNGADVRGNWIHGNHGPGLWADTNDNDFLIEDNLIEGNDSSAIIYEISYNAIIRNNTIRRNNWVEGRNRVARGDSFPVAAIYISESGGEPRVAARTDKIEISANTLQDNWSGITLWENADRFCNSPANTSSGSCTLLVPDQTRCAQPALASLPLVSDCRWKTQRTDIHDNRFELDASVVGCTTTCGRMAVLANFGTYPDWSPYKGQIIRDAVTFDQENTWHANTYIGPWTFMPHDTDRIVTAAQWQALPYRQDTGSTFRSN
ncbi:MAG TPA: right-handed parallel beta-helix repeat-containing protein [Amycolatopsis sp.]|uniref:right-handed parallel beta-helix repeat-containing protein n=1 Tax=Amycolatopsis sp. TaxID=37632 RepID=UPI002B48411A|nr:right-handed parallel beta-helix repeat-containing protein [Amycolatopsis sp.]HKS47421.1 right-handed parallel beta-helix repeat-containing protein [Amycolatopsis sp.]